ncbi:MAG: CRISPR-associated endonuclease Cas6 [Desulforegulaceae bacterium]|nr:CRISPR-associated endonuclease Cas6 [Desulforegulaceae bacterium]
MKKATLTLNDINLKPNEIHKFRGYVGRLFEKYDLVHNHNTHDGKNIYRYPLIQFKIINNKPAIIALSEKAVEVFTDIFMNLEEIKIEDTIIPVFEKDLKVEETGFGYSQEHFLYKFKTPWIALNQKNYKKYRGSRMSEKKELLKQILTGNVLSMCKYLGIILNENERINSLVDVEPIDTNLKGNKVLGFKGVFKINFEIPDFVGIGKSVSRGFGMVEKIL